MKGWTMVLISALAAATALALLPSCHHETGVARHCPDLPIVHARQIMSDPEGFSIHDMRGAYPVRAALVLPLKLGSHVRLQGVLRHRAAVKEARHAAR
jgi:hypothetical protein